MAIDFVSILNPKQDDKKKKKKQKINFIELAKGVPKKEKEEVKRPTPVLNAPIISSTSQNIMTSTPSMILPTPVRQLKDIPATLSAPKGAPYKQPIPYKEAEKPKEKEKLTVKDVAWGMVPGVGLYKSLDRLGQQIEPKSKLPEFYQKQDKYVQDAVLEWQNATTPKDMQARKDLAKTNIPKLSRNIRVGLGGSVSSTIRGVEWLAPKSWKPRIGDVAKDMETNIEVLAEENPTFLDSLTQGAASSATFFIPGLGISKGLQVLGVVGKAGTIAGLTLSTSLESMAEAGGVYQYSLNRGLSEEEASKKAAQTFWANAAIIGISNKLGPFSDSIKNKMVRTLVSSGSEGVQEGMQQMIQNVENGRPIMEGVKESALIGAIIGAPMGLVTTDLMTRSQNTPFINNLDKLPPDELKKLIEQKFGGTAEKSSGALVNFIKQDVIQKEQEKQAVIDQAILNFRQKTAEESIKKTKEPLIDFKKITEDQGTKKPISKMTPAEAKASGQSFDEWVKGHTRNFGLPTRDISDNVYKQVYKNEKPITVDINKLVATENAGTDYLMGRNNTYDKIVSGKKVESPIIIGDFNSKGEATIYDGNHRYYQALKNGESEIKAFTLKDRDVYKSQLKAEWDGKVVKKTAEEIKQEAQIIEEFAVAEAGQRIKQEGTNIPIVQKSTFPKRIPEDLRRKPILDAVSEHILNGTVPTKVAEKRLYDIVQDRIKEKAETKKAEPKEKEINVNEIQFEMMPPKKSESKHGITSANYYSSKGEFSATDIPEHVSNIEMPEMIKFTKELLGGEVPFLRKYPSAYGAFYSDPKNPRIGIDPRIFTDPIQAAKTLAHEIGHLIDFLPEMSLKRGNLLNRLESLINVRRDIFGSEDVIKQRKNVMNAISKYNRTEKERNLTVSESNNRDNKIEELNKLNEQLVMNKEYRDELKELSQFWKPFNRNANSNYTSYRDSSPELYADFISVLFNRPDLAQIKAPKFYQRFFEYLDNKPDIKKAYFEVTEKLRGDANDLLSYRENDILEGFRLAEEIENTKTADRLQSRWKKLRHPFKEAYHSFLEKNTALIDKTEKHIQSGKKIEPSKNPEYLIEEQEFMHNEVENVVELIDPIEEKLKKNDLSTENFGLYLFFKRVTTGRADKANPEGHTPKTAKDGLDKMKKDLGEKRFEAIEESGKQFNEIFNKEMEAARDAGLYSDEFIGEIKDSKDLYSTFRVLDKIIENDLSEGMFKMVGTFKSVGNPYTATISKMVAIRLASIRNIAKKNTVDVLFENIEEGEIDIAGKIKIPIADIVEGKKQYPEMTFKPFRKVGTARLELITWKENGEIRGAYVDPQIALSFKYYSIKDLDIITQALGFVYSNVFRKTYIEYSIRFIFNNPVRDYFATYKALSMKDLQGTGKFKVGKIKLAYNYAMAFKEAWGYARTGKKTSLVQSLIDDKIIGVDQDYSYTKKDFQEAETLEKELMRRGIKIDKHTTNSSKLMTPFRLLGRAFQLVGQSGEMSSKLAAYRLIEQRLNQSNKKINKKTAAYIRNNVGTPNWRKGGTSTKSTNAWFPFSNVALQGHKRTVEMIKDKNTRSGYLWRTVETAILPKLIMIAMAEGLMGDDLRDKMAAIKNYTKQKYFAIPMAEIMGKVVTLKIPMDYTDEVIGSVIWEIYMSAKKGDVRAKEFISSISNLIPTLNNVVGISSKWLDFARGINPYDNYYGTNWISPDNFTVGGTAALSDMLKKTYNEVLGGIWKIPTYDIPRRETFYEKLVNSIPFIDLEYYGRVEENRMGAENELKEDAKFRNKKKEYVNDSIRKMYEENNEEKIDEYMSESMVSFFDKYPDRMDSRAVTDYKKLYMKTYLKSNSTELNILLSDSSIEAQKEAIKELKGRVSPEEYEDYKIKLLTTKLISLETWLIAEAELEIQEE